MVERVEDAVLLTGRRRFADDMGERPGTVSAAMAKRCSPVHHVPGSRIYARRFAPETYR